MREAQHGDDVEELLARARPSKREKDAGRDRRLIYGTDPQAATPGYAVRRQNRRGTRRSVSTFNIIMVLFGTGIAIVLYISNIIAVNKLAVDVSELQMSYDKSMNANAALKAEINRKSGWERIGGVATQEIGLQYPKEQPLLLEVDPAELERAREREQ